MISPSSLKLFLCSSRNVVKKCGYLERNSTTIFSFFSHQVTRYIGVIKVPSNLDRSSGPDRFLPPTSTTPGCWRRDAVAPVNDHRTRPTLDEWEPVSMPTLLRLRAEESPNDTALSVYRNGEWQKTSFSEYYENSRTVAKAFIELGLEPFGSINPIGFNSPEYYTAFQAAPMAGGFIAGIYPTNSPPAVQYVSQHSKGQIAIVEDEEQLQKFLAIKADLKELKAIVQYIGKPNHPEVLSWEEMVQIGKSVPDTELDRRLSNIAYNQGCMLVYTSGTTGNPKGVMLSHDAVTFSARVLGKHTGMGRNTKEIQVQYMPANHVGAAVINVECMIAVGGECWFAGPDAIQGKLVEYFLRIGPKELIMQVPRIWEKFHEKLAPPLDNSTGFKKLIVDWCRKQGTKRSEQLIHDSNAKPTVKYQIANKLLFQKIKKALGIDKGRYFYTAGAPLKDDYRDFFSSIDILVRDLFAASETGCVATANYPDIKMKRGTIGRPLPENEARIHNPDVDGYGDICLRGRNIMMGYLNDEEKTKETLDEDGWLHTGDLGKIDEEGYVTLRGRIKEIIITAGGENIGPFQIEETIKEELPCISNAMVIGDDCKYLTVLLTFKTIVDTSKGLHKDDLELIAIKWLKDLGFNGVVTLTKVLDVLATDPRLAEEIQNGLNRANVRAVSRAQQVQKWTLLEKDFTMAENELTPTLKLKRAAIVKKYKDIIDKMY